MTPTHILVFLSQKPSTKNGIIRPSCNLILIVDIRARPRELGCGAARIELLGGDAGGGPLCI